MKKSLSIIVASFFLLCGSLHAQDVPRIISYQGVLVDASGKPVNDTKNITFRLKHENGAPPNNWSETFSAVRVNGGLFTVALGLNSTPKGFPILDGEYTLEISVDGSDYRAPLYSSVSALNIPDGVVTERKIAKNAVTSRKIKDGEVDLKDLAPGRTTGEILKWNGTEWLRGQDEGLRSVTVEQPIEGDGTSTDPLRVTIPSGVPIGTIVAYYGESLSPTLRNEGWALCNGGAIPTASDFDQMRNLATAAGHPGVYPNLQGYFLRGATENSAIDPDRNSRTGGSANLKIGSRQDDAIMRHQHRTNAPTPKNDAASSAFGSHPSNPGVILGSGDFFQTHAALTDDASAISNKTSSETRPKNVYVNYIIKAR